MLMVCFVETMQKIKEYISHDHKIWISIKKMTDVKDQVIVNVVIGILEVKEPGKIFLLITEKLEKTNYSKISKLIDKSLSIL